MELLTFNAPSTFQASILTSLRSRLLKKNREGRIFRLALSGGSTPGPIYRALAESRDIDWSLVELYLVDERYVPADDERSNSRLIKEAILEQIKPKAFISFDTSLSIPEALDAYEQRLVTSEKAFFDLVLLGMGTDGHTASLFPDDKLLAEKKRWVGHSKKGDPVVDRLTLTYPALESSQEIFFLIRGSKKKSMLNKVMAPKADENKLPASRLIKRAESLIFFGDYEA